VRVATEGFNVAGAGAYMGRLGSSGVPVATCSGATARIRSYILRESTRGWVDTKGVSDAITRLTRVAIAHILIILYMDLFGDT
jgi:hypothetical protein